MALSNQLEAQMIASRRLLEAVLHDTLTPMRE